VTMKFFLYLREYNVIICRECRYAVLPSRLDTHLASNKHRVLRRRRVQVEQEIAAWLELL
jgi:Orsellinic acid/F9775 biosynthesis cluster protein D